MSTNKVVKLPEKKSASPEIQEPVIEPRHKTYEAEQVQTLPEHQKVMKSLFQQARQLNPIVIIVVLALICVLAFFVRIFSVIRYESVIHEFDPWFNYRTTKFLTEKGWYEFWNWYDSESWYPLGRVIGGTIYPGIMGTAASIKWSLDALALPMDIRNICVFLAPVFSGFTAISTYFFAKEATNKPGAGLLAALFISIVPSYISRSVAGSYDNEAVAIFALVNTFYLWLKAVNTGSILWSVACTLQYFYMVAAWGGYSFIINIIPIFVIAVMFANKFTYKIYIAYSVFYILGTVLAMTIPFVTFNAIKSSEHLASHAVYFVMNAYLIVETLRKNLPEQQFAGILKIGMAFSVLSFAFGFVFLTFSGNTKWSGRSMTLLDPTYAKKYIPIIASVSEHQPTSWSTYFFDLGYLILFLPMGYYFCLIEDVTFGKLFIGIYGVLATYFSSVMIRLMLTLAPVVCTIAAIAINELFEKVGASVRTSMILKKWDPSNLEDLDSQDTSKPSTPSKQKVVAEKKPAQKAKSSEDQTPEQAKEVKFRKSLLPFPHNIFILLILLSILSSQIYHSTILAADAYSSPSIIMSHKLEDGSRLIIDDYREAYYWLKQNTPTNARIMSWWDYGYQITGMSNRTVLVDNNTWNNTHIATVGRAFASTETEGYKIARFLGADYVLVIFGGMTNYSGDDISKFLWMIRIAAGVYSQVKEDNFYSNGQYRVDSAATQTMKNSLMYRLCYYRFGEVRTRMDQEGGFDSVRQAVIGLKGFKLTHFEEAYTSERWLVRIYKVLPLSEMNEGIEHSAHPQATRPLPNIPKLKKPEL